MIQNSQILTQRAFDGRLPMQIGKIRSVRFDGLSVLGAPKSRAVCRGFSHVRAQWEVERPAGS